MGINLFVCRIFLDKNQFPVSPECGTPPPVDYYINDCWTDPVPVIINECWTVQEPTMPPIHDNATVSVSTSATVPVLRLRGGGNDDVGAIVNFH